MPETVLDGLNAALRQAMQLDPRVILLGEDILDPYGGAFKVTRGLSSAFAERVITTPISEAGITGAAAGLALGGLRPVIEIMFGDFTTLIADQVINHIAKLRWMYNDTVHLPLVIRAPMGGRRGYGPTHSQSLEKMFMGVPGLTVLAPHHLSDSPGALLQWAILEQDGPVFFVEHKLQYLLPLASADAELEIEPARDQAGQSAVTLRLRGAPPPILTLAAYGYMAELARQALIRLAYEAEIFIEVVIPTRLAPMDMAPLLASISRTGSLLTVEEGTLALGWGSEITARAVEALGGARLHAVRRLAAAETPIPASLRLEQAHLPGVEDMMRCVVEMHSHRGKA